MKMEIEIVISSHMLRDLCIEHNYYTGGTIKDYYNLLYSYDCVPLDGEYIVAMAADIKQHSTTEDTVQEIAQRILDKCNKVIVEVW